MTGRRRRTRAKGISKVTVYRLLLVCMILICGGSVTRLFLIRRSLRAEQNELLRLRQIVAEANESAGNGISTAVNGDDGDDGKPARRRMLSPKAYEELYHLNQDLVGWLRIEGTRVDYPVMQTKDAPQYYLHRNFERKYTYSGLPFLDAGCDLSDSPVLMVYGHHMKNGTMFRDLMNYESRDFFENHRDIFLDTAEETATYRICAAFYADLDASEGSFRYDRLPDGTDAAETARYLEGLLEASLYDTGVRPEEGAQLLLLSTCSYQARNGRFVVAAVRVA